MFLSFERKIRLVASGEQGTMVNSKDCIDMDLMMHVRTERLLWAEHVVGIVENGISKRILEGNLGSRRPAGKAEAKLGKRIAKRCCQIAKDE